uniref:protein NKG7-like n=1 Tax=Euleptes europaea TaxID=460621 RepID=UPI00253F95AE|nr:protein NKG7-like [Euleptes europaea]
MKIRFSFANLSEIFSISVLTQPLRISSAVCSSGSLLMLFTSLTTSYWVTEQSSHGLIHSGLWEVCLHPHCHYFQFNILLLCSSPTEYLHVTRAFLILALLFGMASLLFICISFERVSMGPIYFMAIAGLLSFTTAFSILIANSVFTAVYRSKQLYLLHLVIFGSSYGLCWASLPAYIITGIIIMITHRTTLH